MPNMESACWEWTAAKFKRGYGQFGLFRKTLQAHRVSWIIANGAIPKAAGHHGICVCHRCDNPSCVNPGHLFLGTHTDNMRDMEAKDRRVYFCGESHGSSKLTDSQVLDIRSRYKSGELAKKLAQEYGVWPSAVSKIITRENWKHI